MVEQRLSIPRYWRRIPQYYRLEGVQCVKCGRIYYPPRAVCECGSREFRPYQLPSMGKLLNFTVLYSVPVEFEKMKPLIIGSVDLGGVRGVGQIVDCMNPEKLTPGMDVEVVFRMVKMD
ncbi:MAG: Zn-ribbon domain-containing OB-fold protein, partial [Vulcanisaeta sp.]|nr:Zn-ribbon domain-containing OB-fold protein [Vulcanisaeta sp.]